MMAGIGFTLQKILSRRSYISYLKSFSYGAALSAGPWILTMLTIGLICLFTRLYLDNTQVTFFTVTITYSFAFSLILAGPIQILLMRFVSDQLYLGKKERMLPSLSTALFITVILSGLIAFFFYRNMNVSIFIGDLRYYKLFAGILFVLLSCTWLLLSFTTCSKKYNFILVTFFFGSIVCILASLFLAKEYSVMGAIGGYTGGIFLIAFLLHFVLRREFPGRMKMDTGLLRYFLHFKSIVCIGLFYNLGVWSDKIITWYKEGYLIADSPFHAYFRYDFPTYIAYITMIPALAYFILSVETDFFNRFSKHLEDIRTKPLVVMQQSQQRLVKKLKDGFFELIKFQIVVTLVVFILSRPISQLFTLAYVEVGLLRILLGAALFQVLLLITIIFLLYFEFRREAFLVVTLFLVTNVLFTYLGLYLGEEYYGLGYLFSVLLSFLTGTIILFRKMRNLDLHLFSSQPILGH